MSKQPASFLGTPATAPGPLGPDMLRAFRTIRGNPLEYLHTVWQAHGDIAQFPVPRPPSYLVNSLSGVRRVLIDNARNYGKSTIQYKALSLVTGEGLLTSDGDTWREQRRVLQPGQARIAITVHWRISASMSVQQRGELRSSGVTCRRARWWMSTPT